MQLICGQVLDIHSDPFGTSWEDATRFHSHGAIAIADGKIRQVGDAEALKAAHPEAEVTDMGTALLLPGFVDAHVHYPQTGMIASWGKRLIDWLNTYTFPEEARFGSSDYAMEVATRYLDLTAAHGTTTMASFCTIHPQSVDAFFTCAKARGQAVVAGKTCMDRNAPDDLVDTPAMAYDQSAALIARWHGTDRLHYAITPRFSPTSSPEQLEAMGALWAAHPECLMQTHLSEQTDEIAWVSELYPEARDYLDTYETHGLLGARGLYGHAIHLEPREIDRLAETGGAVVHCPTSNTFIGSGIFQMAALKARGLSVGLATDTGGGSSFSMLRTMAAAYELGQLAGTALHPAQLLWLATAGSATSLHLQDDIGTLAPGSAADLVALNLNSTPAIAQRAARAETIWEAVFPTIMMGDDRAVAGTWIAGRRAV
ncbi:guanine deaminase [Roseobacteraceae bacterium S113]